MKWPQRIATVLAALLALAVLTALLLDSPIGHRIVAERIAALRPDNGLRFRVERIDGSLFTRADLIGVTVSDPRGLILDVPRAALDWRPFAWFAGRLDIRSLDIPTATFAKLPELIDTGRRGPILPDVDIVIGRLRVASLRVAPAVSGRVRQGRIDARADIRSGRAVVDLAAVVDGSDALRARIDSVPDAGRFDVDVRARGSAGGVLARASGLGRALALDIGGSGDWRRWRGRARADVGAARVADLSLGNDAGRYTLAGTLAPAAMTRGRVRALLAPHVAVNGAGTFENKRLDGTLALRSAALAFDADGAVDLARATLGNLRLRARLLRPGALIERLAAQGAEWRAILDGPLDRFRFDYRLVARRAAIDGAGFETVRAAGRGVWNARAPAIPLRFVAARVTGVGEAAGGVLRNLSVDGVFRVDRGALLGRALRVRSDQLNGLVDVRIDLTSGAVELGVGGTLSRFYVKGLGLIDVETRLALAPGARLSGRAAVRVVRLDNGFFRSLAGGLPRITATIARGPDGVLRFGDLVLVAPELRLSGGGYRRADGTIHVEASGMQRSYGPLRLVLDGRVGRPAIDLLLDRPNAALGLSAVRLRLDPDPVGYRVAGAGGSRLGPFTADGRLLLPPGPGARIEVARLDVSGTRASGTLSTVPGGLAGRLAVNGGGLSGTLLLAVEADVQRISGTLAAAGARLDRATLRRGRADFDVRLDPAGTRIDARFDGAGLRRGALSLSRFAGTARLAGGSGEVAGTLAGTRGGGFQIAARAALSPDSYRISGNGTVGRRPIALDAPATVTRDGDAWILAPARLTFAGGSARVSGRFGGGATRVEASLADLPLAVLDIGYAGLGLGGSASGSLSYAAGDGAAPTGRLAMTVRGLTRSGLLLSSQPVDLGVNGVLAPDRAAFRAVMASGGRTVGRAQALLRPTRAGGDLAARFADAGLFAQLRYDGAADTLWRLTRVELFDLTGPVQIAADAGGTLAAPRIRGLVRASGARIQSAATGTVLSDVRAEGRFNGSRLDITSFAAAAGRDGRVTGTGSFDFAGARGVALDLRLAAERAVMIDTDAIGATVTGPLSFRSDGSGGVIAGDVRLDASRYRLGQATAASAVPRLAVREINVPGGGGGADDDAPVAPWRLDVRARASKGLRVSGLGLDSEWSTDVTLAGSPTNPAITGRATLIRGDYEFAGREFDLERGVIRFAGEVPANPALDIEANADTAGLNASIRVTGVAQKPEITFASVPALPQDELLSRLLFGTSITNLSAPEALQLAAAVAALQDGGNGLNPINAVRRAAGLDRLRILPADAQTGQGTSVAAGKYVTRRLYAEIITDGQGYSATRVEYQVTRWLSLLSSISTLGRQSANVRISRDY